MLGNEQWQNKYLSPRIDWERQECESIFAYKAFKLFIEMPERNLEVVAEELSKTRNTIIRWSEKYEWERRAFLFDYFHAQAEKKNSAQEQKKMATQQISLGIFLQAEGVKALKGKDLSAKPVAVILKSIELGIQIGRSARNNAENLYKRIIEQYGKFFVKEQLKCLENQNVLADTEVVHD